MPLWLYVTEDANDVHNADRYDPLVCPSVAKTTTTSDHRCSLGAL